MKRFMLVLVSALLIGALSGCMWNPAGDDTGAITLDFSSFAGALSASNTGSTTVNAARVWLFRGEDRYLLAPTTAYAQVDFASNTGLVTLGGIPEGSGYQVQVVLGHLGGGENGANSWFQPISFGDSRVFEISGGRETPVTINLELSTSEFPGGLTFARHGFNVIGAVYSELEGGIVVTADSVSRTASSADGLAILNAVSLNNRTSDFVASRDRFTVEDFAPVVTTVNGINEGPYGSDREVFVSTSGGVYTFNGSSFVRLPGQPSDVLNSGARSANSFKAGTDTVVFYQRSGGVGGAAFAEGATSDYWSDTDLSDIVGEESPVYDFDASLGSDGDSGRAVFATRLGNFVIDDSFFSDSTDQEINVVDLLTGEDTATGLTTFGLYFPNTTSRLQIRHAALAGTSRVVVGAPRGVFHFGADALSERLSGYVPSSRVTSLGDLLGQFVVDMAASDTYLAVLTRRSLAVYRVTENGPASESLHLLPATAVVMGEPRTITLAQVGSDAYLLIGGSE